VDLEDQVRVLTRLDQPADEVRIGMPVSLLLKHVGMEDGASIVFYAFAPDSTSRGETP
jgi:hypothetical protein